MRLDRLQKGIIGYLLCTLNRKAACLLFCTLNRKADVLHFDMISFSGMIRGNHAKRGRKMEGIFAPAMFLFSWIVVFCSGYLGVHLKHDV